VLSTASSARHPAGDQRLDPAMCVALVDTLPLPAPSLFGPTPERRPNTLSGCVSPEPNNKLLIHNMNQRLFHVAVRLIIDRLGKRENAAFCICCDVGTPDDQDPG
jgi:hypothetical protein